MKPLDGKGKKTKNANTIFHAHRWKTRHGGIRKDNRAPDGDSIGSMKAGAWAGFGRVDFGIGQTDLFMAFLSADCSGRRIEIRIDSPDGRLIAVLAVQETGGYDLFREQYAKMDEVRGVHEVFLVFPDGEAGVDWFTFSADPDRETAAQRGERMRWWREARFGQFIHWGAYAVLARGEWVMYQEQWPAADYEKRAAARFNPGSFRPGDWVRAAKQAGQEYLVFTAKHHDGFCLFDTHVRGFDPQGHGPAAGRYSVVDFTRRKRDTVRELARACRRRKMPFGLYYSILDWHHPSQKPVYDGSGLTEMLPGWKDRYVSGMKEQLRELVEGYDPALLWFDGDWGAEDWWWTAADGAALYRFLRTLKPELIINERVKRDSGLGDFRSPEQNIPAQGLPYDWETCMTMNDHWGYHAGDGNWKSAETLIRNLVDVASKGGNFLLNVGPKPDGTVPRQSRAILTSIGRWIRKSEESIRATSASPFPETPDWGRFTCKPGRLYAHILNRPENGRLRIPRIRNIIRRIYPLDRPEISLEYRTTEGMLEIDLPVCVPPDSHPVIALDVDGTPILQASEGGPT